MLLLLRQGRLSKWFSGIGQEAIAVGVVSALEATDWILPMHRNLGVFTTRGVDLPPALPPAPRQGRRLHEGARPDVPLRPPREAHRRDDQPPRRHAARGVTAWPWPPSSAASERVAAAFTGDGATSEGDFHEAAEPGRGLEAARPLRRREQPVRPLDPGHGAVRVQGPRRSRRRLRDARAWSSTATTCSPWSRRWRRGRRRGPGAAKARPCSSSRPSACAATRRPRAPTTSPRSCSRNGRRRTPSTASRPPLRSGACSTQPTRDALRAELQGAHRRARRRGPGRAASRIVDAGGELRRRLSPRAWLVASTPAPEPRRGGREALHRRHLSDGLREAMRRDAAGRAPGAGHRRVRRRLQGHRRLRGGVRQGARAQHADHRVRRASAPRSASPSTASARWSRCSSATSSPAASTRSSTTWPRPTTAGGRAVPVVIRAPVGGGIGRGPVPLAERRGVVHPCRRA